MRRRSEWNELTRTKLESLLLEGKFLQARSHLAGLPHEVVRVVTALAVTFGDSLPYGHLGEIVDHALKNIHTIINRERERLGITVDPEEVSHSDSGPLRVPLAEIAASNVRDSKA